jgi:hypothetical protein
MEGTWVYIIGGPQWVQRDLREIARQEGYDSVVIKCRNALSQEYISTAVLFLIADDTDTGVTCLENLWVDSRTTAISYGVYTQSRGSSFFRLPAVHLEDIRQLLR